MPLVGAVIPSPPIRVRNPESPLELLASASADDRRRAARALSRDPGAVAVLVEQVMIEPDGNVRDGLFSSLVHIGGSHVAAAIGSFLQSGDAGVRRAAIDALQRLGEDAVSTVDGLLLHPDPDTRLLAVEVTRSWSSVLAVSRLQRIIEGDDHVNVCAAAVDVATELGTDALLAPLAALRSRFPGESFLAFSVDIARSRILATEPREV